MDKEKIILGVDPGTIVMGYGLICVNGSRRSLISCTAVELKQHKEHADRLAHIFKTLGAVIDQYKPDELAIEAPFYGKNAQSMLKLGRAQGVAYAAALDRMVPVFEYSPRKIKQAITGNGNASKEQVATMLQKQFNFSEMPNYLDATDGLAVAVCHSNQLNIKTGDKKYSSWKALVRDKM